MKHYKLAFYILLFSFIWVSCDSDDDPPQINIESPIANSTFFKQTALTLEALITDNKELDFIAIFITGPDNTTDLRKIELSGDSTDISEDFFLEYENDGEIKMEINVLDKAGNNTSEELNFDYKAVIPGSIDLNIKLQYNGEPFVLFEPYNYPDGKAIDFTRFSFYTSEMKLDDVTINEVEFHNLSDSHSSQNLAINGYTFEIDNVIPGNYSTLSFNIGVPPTLNGMDPGEFPSKHPLAKPAENWFSWMSYIFLKLEGNVDLTGDGSTDTGVALHTGSDSALRNIEVPYPILIEESTISRIELVLDIYKLFEGESKIFPIEETHQIHNLDQLDAVEELSNNLKNSISKF